MGQTVSSFGDTLFPVSVAFAVLDLTGSASALGLVLGAQTTAVVVFVLIGGVIADCVSRRALTLGAHAVCGCILLVLGLLLITGRPSVLTLAGLSAAFGTATAVYGPAWTGLLPALVRSENLQQANALQQTSSAAAGIAGPAAAGVCAVTTGPGWAIIADAGTFFFSVATLALVQWGQVPRGAARSWFRDLCEGWKDFWTRKWFRDFVLGMSVVNLLYAVYAVLGPVMSRRYYGGAAAWATVVTSAAIGSVLASLVAMRLRPRYPLRLALFVSAPACLTPVAFAALLPLPVIAASGALGGGVLIVVESLWQTSVQRHVPERVLSRASSYDWFGSLIAYPVGLAVAGPIAAVAGPRLVLFAAGILLIAETAMLLAVPSVRRLTDDPPAR